MASLAQRFTARLRPTWNAMRDRMVQRIGSQRQTTGMTKEQLHHTIETLFLDTLSAYHQALGDGREDRTALQAHLSRQCTERVLQELDVYLRALIGEDEPIEAVYQAWYDGKYPEPVYRFATGKVHGRNRLRAEQRQRAGLRPAH